MNDAEESSEERLIQIARREAAQVREATTLSGDDESAAEFTLPGYRVRREIHRGGQGVVYEATQDSTGKRVAIKVLHGGALAGNRERARFEREVSVLARLEHRNIVTIHDTGEVGGFFYFVMDFVPGLPLDEYVRRTRPAPREAIDLFAKICDAVEEAHLLGVIHRDLKPGNIRVNESGEPCVLDFGLAKLAGTPPLDALTETGQFVGSLPWSSPEQAEGNPDRIDRRTDVYSLGVLLYQILTGRFPYEVTGNVRDVLDDIARAEPIPPRRVVAEINDEVETIVLRCLQKDRGRRYQSAGELARDLRHYLAGEPIEARRDSSLYVLRKTLRRYRPQLVLGSLFLIVIMAGFVVSFLAWKDAASERDRARQSRIEAVEAREVAERGGKELRRRLYFHQLLAARVAMNDENIAQMKRQLEECPDELRGWEWRHLEWLSDRAHRVLRHATAEVTGVAASPSGLLFASADDAGVVRIWDAVSGSLRHALVGQQGPVSDLAFSPDGKVVASAERSGAICIFDVVSGQRLRTLTAESGELESLAFDATGSRLATVGARGLRLWDVDSGEPLAGGLLRTGPFRAVAFSGDGLLLTAGAANGTVTVLDAVTLRERSVVEAHSGYVSSVDIDANGERLLTAGTDGKLRLWRLASGEQLLEIDAHEPWAYCARFSPDGLYIVSSGADHSVKVWHAASGRRRATLRGHTNRVFAVRFFGGGRGVLSGSEDGTARLWDWMEPDHARTWQAHPQQVWSVAVSRDGRYVVSGGDDGLVKIWDTRDVTGVPVTLRGHSRIVTYVTINAAGDLIASTGSDGMVRLWDLPSGRRRSAFRASASLCYAVSFCPDGRRLLAAGHDAKVRLFDIESGKTVRELPGQQGPIRCAAFSPDGRIVASGGVDGELVLWDLSAGDSRRSIDMHGETIWALAFSPDGERLATASLDHTARVINVTTGEELFVMRGHRNGVRTIDFSPDGDRIVTGGWDHSIRLWDARDGLEAMALSGHGARVDAVRFSPDGKTLVSGGLDGTVKLWLTE